MNATKDNGEQDATPLEIWRRANPSIYPGDPNALPVEEWAPPPSLTVGELVAELLKLDQDAKIYRNDSEYGPEPVTSVDVNPARSYDGYPKGRVYDFPEQIVIS